MHVVHQRLQTGQPGMQALLGTVHAHVRVHLHVLYGVHVHAHVHVVVHVHVMYMSHVYSRSWAEARSLELLVHDTYRINFKMALKRIEKRF